MPEYVALILVRYGFFGLRACDYDNVCSHTTYYSDVLNLWCFTSKGFVTMQNIFIQHEVWINSVDLKKTPSNK